VHDLVAGFVDAAAAYDRGRPRYAPAVVAAIVGAVPGPRVLDLAAGTGLLSRALLDAGKDVVAVEPLDGMRAALERAIGPERALAGRAEALPLPDPSVDGAVCGHAWHWFDGPLAAAELRRVVRPGGGVVVSYLEPVPERERPPWWHEVGRILEPLRQAAHHPHIAHGRRPAALEADGGFEALRRTEVPFVHRTDREGQLAYYASISFVGALPSPRRARVLDSLAAVLDRHGIDRVEIRYRAELWVTRRRPAPAPLAGPRAAAS
jgi:SAM-dependent methyltransferase